jgi:isopenicillin N synthase-like dioxygenase
MTDSTLSSPLVPTIDISPYLASPTSAEAQKIISAVRDACTTTGFFQLIGHGIPRKLQDAVFEGSAALFNLPMKEKLKLDRSHSVAASNRGYELFGGDELQEGTLPDLKEVRSPFFPLSSFPILLPNSRISDNGND